MELLRLKKTVALALAIFRLGYAQMVLLRVRMGRRVILGVELCFLFVVTAIHQGIVINIRNNKKSFTLVEIIVVIIIIGMMAAFALPRFGTTVEVTRASEGRQILTALWAAQRKYAIDNGRYANDTADLDTRVNSQLFTVAVSANRATLATVSRTTGEYELVIAENGTIACTDTVAGLCQKIGF